LVEHDVGVASGHYSTEKLPAAWGDHVLDPLEIPSPACDARASRQRNADREV
jgi:hypothetical protein